MTTSVEVYVVDHMGYSEDDPGPARPISIDKVDEITTVFSAMNFIVAKTLQVFWANVPVLIVFFDLNHVYWNIKPLV